MSKYAGRILLAGGVCFFLIYFVPLWYDGMTRSRYSQMCTLNQSAALWEINDVIVEYSHSKSNGGYIDFELSNGNVYPMMEWVFKNQLDTIASGDRIVKNEGELFLRIIGPNKTLSYSLDHGCPDWASIH